MNDKTLSSGVAGALIAVMLAGAAALEWRAMMRDEDRHDNAPTTMTAQMCQSCHSDTRMLAAIKEKQGAHNTAPVFLPVLDPITHKPLSHPTITAGSASWPIK
jgi:hypothetical protein